MSGVGSVDERAGWMVNVEESCKVRLVVQETVGRTS